MKNKHYLVSILLILSTLSSFSQNNMKLGEFEYDDIKFDVIKHDETFLISKVPVPKFSTNPEYIEGIHIDHVMGILEITGHEGWRDIARENISDWNDVTGRGEYIIANFECDPTGRIIHLSFIVRKNTNFSNTAFGLLYKRMMNKMRTLKITSPNNMHEKLNHISFASFYMIE